LKTEPKKRKMKKIAVIISGNGVYDGAEIHETVFTMWAIVKHGAQYQLFAPDKDQHHVINHFNGEEMPEKRNVLTEAARIARGNIKALDAFHAEEYDALILPGGYGVAKNLSTFAFDGPNCIIDPDLERSILEMIRLKKPIGALCIAPVVLAKVIADQVKVSIGNDAETAKSIEKMGAHHTITGYGEISVDEKYKTVTNPCYMLDSNIAQIAEGAEKVVEKILELA
jgi:enhancing lycopene biosynthesis protein 2